MNVLLLSDMSSVSTFFKTREVPKKKTLLNLIIWLSRYFLGVAIIGNIGNVAVRGVVVVYCVHVIVRNDGRRPDTASSRGRRIKIVVHYSSVDDASWRDVPRRGVDEAQVDDLQGGVGALREFNGNPVGVQFRDDVGVVAFQA